MIKLQNLTKREGKKVIFENLNCEMKKGEIIGVLGQSGTGKTILLDMIIGLKKPNVGNIIIDGKDIFENILEVRRKIGYMSETPIYQDMTVREYLKFLAKIRYMDMDEGKVTEYLNKFGIIDKDKILVGNLQESDKKLLAIAGAYLGTPPIILLDDPFTGLDADSSKRVIDSILKDKKDLITIIATSNDKYLKDLCDKMLLLNKDKDAEFINASKYKK